MKISVELILGKIKMTSRCGTVEKNKCESVWGGVIEETFCQAPAPAGLSLALISISLKRLNQNVTFLPSSAQAPAGLSLALTSISPRTSTQAQTSK